jgi:hypothetical protein
LNLGAASKPRYVSNEEVKKLYVALANDVFGTDGPTIALILDNPRTTVFDGGFAP